MRITTILLCLSLMTGLFSTHLNAQDAPLVYSIVGKAKYEVPGQKAEKLVTGKTLGETGKLILKKNTHIGVYYNDAYTYISGPVTFDLSELNEKLDFRDSYPADHLGKRINEATHPYYDVFSPGFTGGGSSTKIPPKKEADGGGNKDRVISIISPLPGKVGKAETDFAWTFWEPKDSEWTIKSLKKAYNEFTFEIKDQKGNVVYQQLVKGFKLNLNLTEVGCKTGQTYRWSLTATKDAKVDSGPIEMIYTERKDFDQVRMDVRKDDVYQLASPTARLLIEAASYEYFGYVDAARRTLEEAQKKKNYLAKRTYASFKYRWNIE